MQFRIETVTLKNYRRFLNFSLRLRDGNVLVGPNNSGKSSILDAFRVLETCIRHSRSKSPVIINTPGQGIFNGYEVLETLLPFKLDNIANDYNADDSAVEFKGTNGNRAATRMHPDRPAKFYIDAGFPKLTSSSKFRAAFPVDLVIVPTLAPLEADELYVQDETARRNSTTRLASRVLRNIWHRKTVEEFEEL